MAHLSDLAHQRQTLTEQLLSGLVCTVLETQVPSISRSCLLMCFCRREIDRSVPQQHSAMALSKLCNTMAACPAWE